MTRLLIHVEGQTEETFVNEVLAPHLQANGFHGVTARLLGNARLRERRGGIQGWASVRQDVLGHLKGDSGCMAAVMVDYYGLPTDGPGAWPGRKVASTLPFADKSNAVLTGLVADISAEMGAGFKQTRFAPYVMMHEFEALLFSDCDAFANGISRPDLASKLKAIRDTFDTPEHINDNPLTAPSKRVVNIIPTYQKPLFGTLAALEIGLAPMRRECPHLDKWMSELEAFASSA